MNLDLTFDYVRCNDLYLQNNFADCNFIHYFLLLDVLVFSLQ